MFGSQKKRRNEKQSENLYLNFLGEFSVTHSFAQSMEADSLQGMVRTGFKTKIMFYI